MSSPLQSKKTVSLLILITREHKSGHKEIDHALPFLYFFSNSVGKTMQLQPTQLMFSTYRSQLSDRSDSRIRFVRNNFKCDLVDLETGKWLKGLIRSAKFLENIPLARPYFIAVKRFLRKYDKARAGKNISKNMISDNFKNADIPIIISLNHSRSIAKIASQIKDLVPNASWWVIPHGTEVMDNKMVHDDHMSKVDSEESLVFREEQDATLVTSERDRAELLKCRLVPSKIHVIGSPRFCREWLNIKDQFGIDGANPPYLNGKIRILFLCPKKFINIWHEELSRTIEFLAAYKDFDVILNGDSLTYPELSNPDSAYENIRRCRIGGQYSTSALITWADAVFHLGTGVIFDSFSKRKLTVLPAYASANTFISDCYGAGVNLRSRDDLRDFCNRLQSSVKDTESFYEQHTGQNLDQFLEDFIDGGKGSVQDHIGKVFDEIFAKTNAIVDDTPEIPENFNDTSKRF